MKPDRVVDRRRGPAGDAADDGAVRAVHADRRADHGDGLRQRRAVQVRRERDAGDADLVHERDRATSASSYGADVDQVRRAVGSDRRIGPSFLFPGVGYGGSCFPKDVQGDPAGSSADKGYDFQILEAVERSTRQQKALLVEQDASSTSGRSKGRTIAVWGLAFKPRTDDMREAPAIAIIERLLEAGATVQAYDPEAMKVAQGHLRQPRDVRRRGATTRWSAPTRWRWSPSGTSSASRTSRRCAS